MDNIITSRKVDMCDNTSLKMHTKAIKDLSGVNFDLYDVSNWKRLSKLYLVLNIIKLQLDENTVNVYLLTTITTTTTERIHYNKPFHNSDHITKQKWFLFSHRINYVRR